MRTKIIYRIIVMLFVFSLANSMNAQVLNKDDYDMWDETTYDEAYTAPSSLIANTWISQTNYGDGDTYIFKADGTFKECNDIKDKDFNVTLTITIPGTWKRNKGTISWTLNPGKTTLTCKKEDFAKLSLRRQDELKAYINAFQNEAKRSAGQVNKNCSYEILRLDKNIMVLGTRNRNFRGGFKRDIYKSAAYLKAEADKKQPEADKKQAEAREAPVNTSMAVELKKKNAEKKLKEEQEYLQALSPQKQESLSKAKDLGIEFVDLGLSVRWSNNTLKKPNSKMDQWGKISAWENGDQATKQLGIGFHAPTKEQWKELFDKCRIEPLDDNRKFLITGPNGNSITISSVYYWISKENTERYSYVILHYNGLFSFHEDTDIISGYILPVME